MQIRQKRRKIKKMMIVNLKSMKKRKRKRIITNQYSTSFGTTGLIKMNQLGTSLKIQKKIL